jgi:hypothetical protein
MFISRKEKASIEQSIGGLLVAVDRLNSEVLYLSAKIKVLEGAGVKKKRTMSPEGRAKMSQMMKERHAKNKLESNK